MVRIIRTIALAIAMQGLMSAAEAEGTITVGAPKMDGTETFTITLENGTKKVVKVPVTKGMSATDKAMVVADAIQEANVEASLLSATPPTKISLPRSTSVTFLSESGENDSYKAALLPGTGRASTLIGYGLLANATGPAGFDPDGSAARYAASFEFDGVSSGEIVLAVDLAFADLLVPTIDGLLQQEYALMRNQLLLQAPSLLSFLTLDLAADTITFAPLGYFASASASNGTTDRALSSNFAVMAVAEPSTIALIFVTLLCALRIRPRGWAPGRLAAVR